MVVRQGENVPCVFKVQRRHEHGRGSQLIMLVVSQGPIADYYGRNRRDARRVELKLSHGDGIPNVPSDAEHDQGDSIEVLCEDAVGVQR